MGHGAILLCRRANEQLVALKVMAGEWIVRRPIEAALFGSPRYRAGRARTYKGECGMKRRVGLGVIRRLTTLMRPLHPVPFLAVAEPALLLLASRHSCATVL